ncbi:MAG TPA: hypothetical protein VNX23_08975 [Bradyrhizobium sp.]|jgi:hypothetical protein|uniref:hypothetical protein n=1 Tax=Bradyrhizobium sp. TaxID=376 RepID=UPI002B99EB82|nr:hypothetical protein [Bradyrhizobium sp.]HXB77517.1 hypothetical protein [Bradyrhizobium sp.]
MAKEVKSRRMPKVKGRASNKSQPDSRLADVREPNDAEKHAIAAARQILADMPPRFEVGTRIKSENGVTQVLQGPKHFDLEGWRAQFMVAFGTSSETVVQVEVQRIAGALRQRDGKIDPAELDTVIAIVSGQQPKNELEAMVVSQMAVTHALTMRSFGNLNQSNEIQQQDSNALAVARLTKAFASQVDALAKLRRGGEQRVVVEHVHVYPGGQAIVGTVNHTGGPGVLENQRQPHAPNHEQTSTPTSSETLRSEDPEREAMSVSSGEGPKSLPDARRGSRVGRAIRRA